LRTRADHFPLFNGLRGAAALAIVLYHGVYQPAVYQGVGEWWWRYAAHFDVAVPIFLALSGFLLYHPFAVARLRERSGHQAPPSLRRYAVRRVLRIVPGYWFWLTVLALWYWALPPGFEDVRSAEGIARFYGFAQIYDAGTVIKGIGQAWTVNVEVSFYLLLPLWIVLARRFTLRTELIGLGVLILASIAWKAWILSRVDPSDPASLSSILPLPTWIDQFAVGIGLAAVTALRPRPVRRVWPLVVGAALCWLAAVWVGPDGSPRDPVTDGVYLARHSLYTLMVAFLVAAAAWGTGGLLRWRPLAYVGLISYSLYLVHTEGVIRQQARWWGGLPDSTGEWMLWTLAFVSASVALGALGFHFVEKPFMQLRASRRRREQLAAPAGQATSRSSAS